MARWLVAVRDHPDRPPADQCHVLMVLPVRLDWSTGQGFASVETLRSDSGRSEATVRRALRWAQSEPVGLLRRLRRGHRLGSGQVAASEWKLLLPGSQPVSRDGLSTCPTGQPGRVEQPQPVSGDRLSSLNRSAGQSQPVSGDGLSESSTSERSLALRARIRAALPHLAESDAAVIAEGLAADPAIRKPDAWLSRVIDAGDVKAATARYLAGHTSTGQTGHRKSECSAGAHRECPHRSDAPEHWCECSCHGARLVRKRQEANQARRARQAVLAVAGGRSS